MNENNISERRDNDKIQQLKLELEAAHNLIAQMQADHKKSVHDIANPLQIISMTIESIEEKTPEELRLPMERMKRAAEAMTSIILTMRKARLAAESNSGISRAV